MKRSPNLEALLAGNKRPAKPCQKARRAIEMQSRLSAMPLVVNSRRFFLSDRAGGCRKGRGLLGSESE